MFTPTANGMVRGREETVFHTGQINVHDAVQFPQHLQVLPPRTCSKATAAAARLQPHDPAPGQCAANNG